MASQELRDKTSRLLGKIEVLPDGKHQLRDHIGNLKGTYNLQADQTRDRIGNLVGKGNLLAMLL